LWLESQLAVAPLPKGVVAVPEPIRGTGFFSGGYGLWIDGRAIMPVFPEGQVMIVGQDFNSVAVYERARFAGIEVGTSTTWKNLRPILLRSDLAEDAYFFTNVYMGLRDGGPETGRFPGARDRDFAGRCMRFFIRQLEVSKPRLILTLGLEPLRFLCRLIMKIPPPKTLTACERIYDSVRLADGSAVVVVGLTHPSYYHANVGRRSYGRFVGLEAENAMIRDGLRAAFGDYWPSTR
jgi:uracil-DNA glycosylase